MKTKNIKQSLTIKAPAAKVYDAFMSEKEHQEFTGLPAVIDHKVGGKFVTCGTLNFGYTLYLEPGKRIIQAWSHGNFPDNQYSVIDIELTETKKGSTKLLFRQLGAPEKCVKWLAPGWEETYWKPLRKYLEKGVVRKLKEKKPK